MEGILIPIGFFALVFGIVYVIYSARHKERMNLINNGADPALFESKVKIGRYNVFKWGLFLIGLAVGIIAANVLVENTSMDEIAAYFSMILFFGGLALVVAFLLRKRLDTDTD